MILILNLLKESFNFAAKALKTNLLRTGLTLSGVSIGIFSIISIFTLVDTLKHNVQDSLSFIDDNTIYIEKWPWTSPEGEEQYPWWKYVNRPQPSEREAQLIERKSKSAGAVSFIGYTNRSVNFEKNTYPNMALMGVSNNFADCWNFNISEGRYFSNFEFDNGKNVAIIGAKAAEDLFGDTDPLNKSIKIGGNKVSIVGVIERSGNSIMTSNLDGRLLIPLGFFKRFTNLKSNSASSSILTQCKEGANPNNLKLELESILRNARRIKPIEENTFALNESTSIQRQFDTIFGVINLAGWLIGGFSILVGGFGIANIMFVTVKERTRIIGIQKALGAKRHFIMLQFLMESVFLSLMGGAVGLILVFLITITANALIPNIEIVLGFSNILRGILISATLGVASGLIPANNASKLNPVVAMSSI